MLVGFAVMVTGAHFLTTVDCFLLNFFVIFVVFKSLLVLHILLSSRFGILLSMREVICDTVHSFLV